MTERITFCKSLLFPVTSSTFLPQPLLEMAIVTKADTIMCWKDGEEPQLLSRLLDVQTSAATWEGILTVSSKVKCAPIMGASHSPCGIYPREMKAHLVYKCSQQLYLQLCQTGNTSMSIIRTMDEHTTKYFSSMRSMNHRHSKQRGCTSKEAFC